MRLRESKRWIDNASYETLLKRWRFAKSGDDMFQGDIGKYYSDAMQEKKDDLPHKEQVEISKRIGWG